MNTSSISIVHSVNKLFFTDVHELNNKSYFTIELYIISFVPLRGKKVLTRLGADENGVLVC